jgi:predicted transport protein
MCLSKVSLKNTKKTEHNFPDVQNQKTKKGISLTLLLLHVQRPKRSHGSSVSIVSDYGLDDRVIEVNSKLYNLKFCHITNLSLNLYPKEEKCIQIYLVISKTFIIHNL